MAGPIRGMQGAEHAHSVQKSTGAKNTSKTTQLFQKSVSSMKAGGKALSKRAVTHGGLAGRQVRQGGNPFDLAVSVVGLLKKTRQSLGGRCQPQRPKKTGVNVKLPLFATRLQHLWNTSRA